MQQRDNSLAKPELCLQWGSQAGAWEPETKVLGGTGILPVQMHRFKTCATETKFLVFSTRFFFKLIDLTM
jgi:hypothetical protein